MPCAAARPRGVVPAVQGTCGAAGIAGLASPVTAAGASEHPSGTCWACLAPTSPGGRQRRVATRAPLLPSSLALHYSVFHDALIRACLRPWYCLVEKRVICSTCQVLEQPAERHQSGSTVQPRPLGLPGSALACAHRNFVLVQLHPDCHVLSRRAWPVSAGCRRPSQVRIMLRL